MQQIANSYEVGQEQVTAQNSAAEAELIVGEHEAALVPLAHRRDWTQVACLPTPVTVSVPIAPFRVRDVIALTCGAVIASTWRGDDDIPMLAGAVQLCWAVFEASDDNLCARITRVL
jgi:hypothetical protein